MDNMYEGENFLNRLYKDLHMREEVMHTALPRDSKDEKVHKYLERLEKVENMARESKYNGMKHLKNLYYRKYVIKPENVPESYFELQKKIALERGFGHVDIDDTTREEMVNTIVEEQKKSLDVWLDYLMSEDAMYPEWFKYYAFQGMLKLGSYDKGKGTFNKRTSSTTNIFVDLNHEALALTYDNLCNVLEGKSIDDESLQKLIENGSFAKIYGYLIKKLDSKNKELLDNNDGIWVKYNRGSKADELVNSLQGKGTGWCTAGYETAKMQLECGDFHVYYTKDREGNYTQPRIAIRMEGNRIGEIRGIAEHQNMESEMEGILSEKLEEFPDKGEYLKKVHDMEVLTKIYKEHKHRQLTKEEIRFLYEVEEEILGFGFQKDPRIKEVLDGRNFKRDLSFVFDCSEKEISNNKKDVLRGKKIVYFYGNLDLSNIKNTWGLKLPQIVGGDLLLDNLRSAKGLILPKIVYGHVSLISIKEMTNCVFPEYVAKSLFLPFLIQAYNITLPKFVGGNVSLGFLQNLNSITLPQYVGGDFALTNLLTVEDSVFPKNIEGALILASLKSAKRVIFPENVGDILDLSSFEYAEEVKMPETIGDYLLMGYKNNVDGMIVPKNFTCKKLYANYITMEDLINKSLEGTQVEENHRQMGFSNIYILVLFTYVTSLILTLIGFLILK